MKSFNTYSLLSKSGQRKYLTEEERIRYIKASEEFPLSLKLFFQMLFWTGARISEVLNLKIHNINISESLVILESLKKRKKGVFRQIPIPPKFLKHLLKHMADKNDHAFIWDLSRRTASRYIHKLMTSAQIFGIQACSKGLRHSFAIHCLTKGIPLTLIQKWMGHSNLETTAIYLNVVGEEEKQFARRIWNFD